MPTRYGWIHSARSRALGSLRVFLLVAVWIYLPVSAFAEGVEGEAADEGLTAVEVAGEAQQVVDSYCAGLQGDRIATRADALGVIGPAYARVSQVYERTEVSWLLYWRGVLGQCLGQLDSAEVDLFTFVARRREDTGLRSLVSDAQRRLKIIERQRGGRGSAPAQALSVERRAGLVAGVGFAGAAALGAVGVAVEATHQERVRQSLYEGGQARVPLDLLTREGEDSAKRQSVAIGLLAGFGAASALAFVFVSLPAVSGSSAGLTLGPTPLGLGLRGSW